MATLVGACGLPSELACPLKLFRRKRRLWEFSGVVDGHACRNAIVNLRIATSESWRDRNSGERREKTEWHRVVIFSEGLCKVAEQYLKKGSTIYIEGQLQTRTYEKEGQTHCSTISVE